MFRDPRREDHTICDRGRRRSEVVTMTVYAHVPGDQKRAAARFAELVGEA